MNKATLAVQRWVKDFVIGYDLCPFARKVAVQNRIKYSLIENRDVDEIMPKVLNEIQLLHTTPASKVDTVLIILPNALGDFGSFLDFTAVAEQFLAELYHEPWVQIATFHPLYQFAGTGINDAENYTNRSPYPILHLLREESLTIALENYGDPNSIFEKNIQTMQKLGLEHLKRLMTYYP